MPRGYRHIVLAAFGWVILASSPPGQRTQSEQSETAEQAQKTELNTARTASSVNKFKPTPLEWPCKPGKDDRQSDLCAQWKAADAARDAAEWARLSFWLGIAGTVGLFATLHYTRKAVKVALDATKDADEALKIAERNADAAAAQVRTSENTAERQLRAYVGHKGTRVGPIVENGQTFLYIQHHWTNTGATPAYQVREGCSLKIIAADLPADFDFYCPARPGMFTISPRVEILSDECRIDLDTAKDAASGKVRVFVWSWIEYSDIFPSSPRRRTESAHELIFRSENMRSITSAATPLNRHNGMDFDCAKPCQTD